MKTNFSLFKSFFLLCSAIIFCSSLDLKAQNYLVTFAGTGSATDVDSVIVENVTQGTFLKMGGSDVLHLLAVLTGVDDYSVKQENTITVMPNPASDNSRFRFTLIDKGEVLLSIYDASGKILLQKRNVLSPGIHTYRLEGMPSGIYLINVCSGNYNASGKFISMGTDYNVPDISPESSMPLQKKSGSKNGYVPMQYNAGDRVKTTGISGAVAINSNVFTADTTITFDFYPCIDADSTKYATIKLGTQVWMAENLKTTKYNDGSPVTLAADSVIFSTTRDPFFCWLYNDESTYKNHYGGLYNYYAVNSYKLCPSGWHVPSVDDWITLQNYLIANGYNYDNTLSDNKIGKSVAAQFMAFVYLLVTSSTLWDNDANTGSVGNIDYSSKFNSSGFSAIPVGFRSGNGSFNRPGYISAFWSSTEKDISRAYYQQLLYNWEYFNQNITDKLCGFPVRCVKD